VRGGENVLLEGPATQPRGRAGIPTLEKARAFYESTEYVAARAAREGAAVMNMVAVAGL
jgi:uncharacterized protein (DUF1330 family)